MGCMLTAAWMLLLVTLALVIHFERRRREQRRVDGERVTDVEARLVELRTAVERLQPGTSATAPDAPRPEPEPEPLPSPTGQPPEAAAPTPPFEPPMPLAAADEEPQAAPPPEAAPPPPEPSAPQAPPPSPPKRIDWEQWVGVRGAAVLGAIVLGFAAILFVRYSIQAGLIPPAVRVALVMLAGVASIFGAEPLRKRGYVFTADGLAGAGIVMLYAGTWAARGLFELIGAGTAFTLMALVTVASGVLSWRHHSRLIALMGLIGGFATPLLLSTGSDRPIGLFGYLLLLNLGVSFLARRGTWPILSNLALAGTVTYQALWIFSRMGSERVWLGLVILAVFAMLYVAIGAWQHFQDRPEAGERGPIHALITQAGGVVTPFFFALYFAANADLGRHLLPLATLLLLLNAGAAWLSRVHRMPLLGAGGAAASLAVVAVWAARTRFDSLLAWEAVGVLLAFAALHHLFLELIHRAQKAKPLDQLAAGVSAAGSLFLVFTLLFARTAPPASHFWIWLAGWLAAAILLLRQSAICRSGIHEIVAALGLGFGFVAALGLVGGAPAGHPSALVVLGLSLLVAIALQGWALRRSAEHQRTAEAAAALFPGLFLASWMAGAAARQLEVVPYHVGGLLLALLVVLSATRLGSGLWYGGAMALLALAQGLAIEVWTRDPADQTARTALLLQAGAVVFFTLWPLVARLRTAGARRAAALAAPLWFLSLYGLWREAFGEEAIGLLAIGLAALSLGAGYRSLALWSPSDPQRRSALAWFGAATLGFVALAIPLQLDREWITLGWALEGLAVTALWRRLDHPGLKYFGLALHTAVTVRLLANPELFDYHSSGSEPFGLPVLNWLIYTYLVPAAALLLTARILWPLEAGRQRPSEAPMYATGRPVIATSYALATIAIVFAWINLTIFDAFAPGAPLSIAWDRLPARDLTLSLSWAVYALLLLVIGIARGSGGLRWISLAFLLLAIGKVFLYDLGELSDLYRVASLVGLAMSLIVVSLLYQRFVFGASRREQRDSRQ